MYNAGPYLERSLGGLRNQSLAHDQYEVIAVDNNSTDGSKEIAAGYSDVIVLSQPVQGSYAARNMGIRHARCDIIAFIDPDCVPEYHWLESILAAIQSASVALVLGRRQNGHSVLLDLLSHYEEEKLSFVLAQKKKELYYGYTNNMAVRRDVFDRVGLFQERARGGDTMFVNSVVTAFGCDAMAFESRMQVDHLEIRTIADYYRKRHIYGQSNERIHQSINYRPLNNRERAEIFLHIVRTRRINPLQAVLLLVLLVPGVLLFEWGRKLSRSSSFS